MLSASTVMELASSKVIDKCLQTPELKAYYPLKTDFLDYSGNGYHGQYVVDVYTQRINILLADEITIDVLGTHLYTVLLPFLPPPCGTIGTPVQGASITCGYFDAHILSSEAVLGDVINEYVELDPRIGKEVIPKLTSYSFTVWLNYRSYWRGWSR